jgi:hypothetical protein
MDGDNEMTITEQAISIKNVELHAYLHGMHKKRVEFQEEE